MDFWNKLLGKENTNTNKECQESTPEVPDRPAIHHADIPNTLDLGWYWSDNKQEHQMAKVAEKDRSTHFYVIGATGSGKTKFLEFLVRQDIQKGNGFGVIDPHGDLIEDIKGFLACQLEENEISERVVLIEPTASHSTVTFNPLEKLSNVSASEQASELVSSFRKIWSDSWGVRMEDLMRNSLIALGEAALTLVDLPHFLNNRAFRGTILEKVNHPVARGYFQRFDTMTDKGQITWIEPVMNKINAILSDERIRQIFSSPRSSFDLREIMDQQKILLVKLDKGKLKDSADLLGSLLMAKIQMAAFSRSDLPKERRTPFYLYIDEFQNFASDNFSVILSEARKYGLSLIMAHQTLGQISEELKSLILGNTGIQVYFRVNRHDASLLAKEAFEYSGYEVKTMSLHGGLEFWSLGEEWEHYTQALQSLPSRACFVKHKIEGGVIPIQTAEIEPPWEILGVSERECTDLLKNIPFGGKYLVERAKLVTLTRERQRLPENQIETTKPEERSVLPAPPATKKIEHKSSREPVLLEKAEKIAKDGEELTPEERVFLDFISKNPGMFVTKIYGELQLSGYKGDRLKAILLEKGLISQEETRDGQKGRLAKVLSLADKGKFVLLKSPVAGKGGDLHRYLQMTLKEQAELFGWKAVIEERIPKSLESVDVGLKKDDFWVAIEICQTTKADQEIQNIRKCLEAGYDYVISVCSDDKGLSSLKTEAKKSFTFKERERLRFYHPSKVKEFLKGVDPAGIVSEKGIVSAQISKQKQLMDTTAASEFLGIKKNTLYEWIIQKKVPHVKVGRLVKFRREELEEWLKKRTREEDKRDFI